MMHFEHPLGQIVLINVSASGSSTSNAQLPIVDSNVVPLATEVIKLKSYGHNSSSSQEDHNRTPDYEEPRKLMIQKSPLSRFTGGYEKPYAHPLRPGSTVGSISSNQIPIATVHNPSSRPHYQSSSICSSNDSSSSGSSSVGDSHSTCSSSLSHGSPSNGNSSLAVAASIEMLPECIQRLAVRRAPIPPEHSTPVLSVIESSTKLNNKFASRQRIPDSDSALHPPPLLSDEVDLANNRIVHSHCYLPRIASTSALNEKAVPQTSNKSLEINCTSMAMNKNLNDSPSYDSPLNTTSTINHSSLSLSSLITNCNVQEPNAVLSELEMNRIELFYRSQRTQVFVAGALARLLFTRAALSANRRQSAPLSSLWTEAASGVPVLLLDRGGLKTRAKRQLRLCLADRRSGFPLFTDLIDHLSDYKSLPNQIALSPAKPSFAKTCLHTFYLSTDHRKMAGLRFLSDQPGCAFLERMQFMTSIPANIALTGPKAGNISANTTAGSQIRLEETGNSRRKHKPPRKSEISSPCLFQHVTSLNESDVFRLHQLISLTNAASSRVDIMQKPD